VEENPYQSPQASSFENQGPAGAAEREKARRVAKYQRWVIFTLLANILLYILASQFSQSNHLVSFSEAGITLAICILAIFAAFTVFMLAKELSGTGVAILCAILMFVPCVALVTLLIVNQMATRFLKSQGIRVGFLGIDPKNIRGPE
jgi:cytochrome bd-type quinol oxidase subunit 2